MFSRFLRHGHRGSLAGNGRTGRRRFSAKVIFSTVISYEGPKCQVAKVTPQTPTLGLGSLWMWCESGLKRAWKGPEKGSRAGNGRKRAEFVFALFAPFLYYPRPFRTFYKAKHHIYTRKIEVVYNTHIFRMNSVTPNTFYQYVLVVFRFTPAYKFINVWHDAFFYIVM